MSKIEPYDMDGWMDGWMEDPDLTLMGRQPG